MHNFRTLSIVVFVVAACGTRNSSDDRDARDPATSVAPAPVSADPSCGGNVVTDSAVGVLHIGQTVADAASRCTIVRDTTAIRGEGQSGRVLDVAN